MMVASPRFQKSFLIGFALSVSATVVIVYALTLAQKRPQAAPSGPARHHEIDQDLIRGFPKGYFDESAQNPNLAKEKKTFWVRRSENVLKGAGLRLTENPELLPILFPGYPADMARDRSLWDHYFQHEFGCDSWMPALSAKSKQGVLLSYSWTGCFDVYKRYGADVLVFGSSEVFRDIVPSLLSQELGGLKVLMCATTAMPLEAVRMAARELRGFSKPRAKLVVWGFEAWNAFTYSSERRSFIGLKENDFRNYQNVSDQGLWTRLQSYKLSRFFLTPSWDSVLAAYDQWPSAKAAPLAEEPENPLEKFSPALAQDANALKARIESLPPKSGYFKNMTPFDCDLGPANRELDATLREIQKITDLTLIYITPVLPRATKVAHDCFMPALKQMLSVKAGERVLVSTNDWHQYGLEYKHYLWPREDGDGYSLDTNHTNYEGAQQFTRKLAALVKARPR